MNLITIQLRTKMKILTKYAVKPYFYNVILRMIFWNMKYLFFFNCQLLLLRYACCKIAIQDFMQQDRQAYKQELQKYWQFYQRLYRRHRTYRYYTESWKKMTAFCHNHRRVYRWNGTCRYFTESWIKNYGILPLSSTAIPTDDAHPKTHACQTAWSVGTVTDRFADGHGKSNAPVLWHTIPDGPKNLEGFLKFFVRISINYRQKLLTEFNATT
jgi:hypothetical protein